MREKDVTFWLLLMFAFIYIVGNIGTGSLTTWDEAVYANISGSIIKTGNWLVLHQRGAPWFDKPPLYMWCTAFFYNLFGINEFSTRFTSAIFGIATVLLVYVFMKKTMNRNAGLCSALLLLAAPHYIHYSKMGMMDVMLTFFITLMVALFWMGQEKPRYLFWSGAALFFAYLTKGMAAISGPVIIFLYCLFSNNLRLLVKREFITGILISLALIVGWHALQYIYCGPASVNNYFGFHLVRRATESLEGHTGGLNFYQKVIFNKNKPWGILYYPSLVYILWLAVKQKDKRAILLLVWAVSVFAICTTVRTKLHWYIIPVYPALAMASALFLERFLKDKLFYAAITVILLAMLVQVPVSWAFKLNLNPDVKKAAMEHKKLSYDDDGTIFYYSTVNLKNKSGG
jgi:4-amino-4-deoxy-L-arabinose transferase-like glycosyltransferase